MTTHRAVLVTGAAGFIGSTLVRELLAHDAGSVIALDALTYAGHRANLDGLGDDPRVTFERADVTDAATLDGVFARHRPDAVLHLAAESHVDRSIDGPARFLDTNVRGTFALLEAARHHWQQRDDVRFVHVSTDEVYGSLGPLDPPFTETSPYAPRSPYAASKAASDHLARAWRHTYGLPTLVTNCSNNYGPRQYPEKLVPTVILKALRGEPIPVYGHGSHVRDWLHVRDHARGLIHALEHGTPGATYLFGGRNERSNLDLVRSLCAALDEVHPRGAPHADQITFVADRPGHDHRYGIDPARAERDLGWHADTPLDDGLRDTVRWYLEHGSWVDAVLDGRYDLQRQGLTP